MTPNQKLSEMLALLGASNPASVAAGTVTSGWIDPRNFHAFLAVVQTGVLGASATVDAKIQQAQDNAGTGVKDVAGKSIAQLVKASHDNCQALINLKAEDLDTANGFGFFRLSITVGTAASVVGAAILGSHPRFSPASDYNQAAVVQVAG